MISEEQLFELERLANAATEGPWTTIKSDMVLHETVRSSKIVRDVCCAYHGDADFIAAAREAVPALIVRVRELEAAEKGATRIITDLNGCCDIKDKQIERLEREADWLASQLAKFDTCPNEMLHEDVDCFLRCERHMHTKPCWRAFATKAVKDVSNNA